MFNGSFGIYVGILAIVISFFSKNDKSTDAIFIKKYNKQVLIGSGIAMMIFGTIDFLRKGV